MPSSARQTSTKPMTSHALLADGHADLFSALTTHSPVGVFVADAAGLCVYVNERWCELAGMSADEALGTGWAGTLHPEDSARVRDEWADAAQENRDSVLEYRFLRPDGEVAWVQGFASAVLDPKGALLGWVGTCLDLTAHKRAEAAARAASGRLHAAFDNAPIGMTLVSPDGRWLQANEAFCALVGYSSEELCQMTLAELTHPDDLAATVERRNRQRRGDESDRRIEKRYIRSDGAIVWASVTSTVVRDSEGESLYSVAQIEDITGRMAKDRALEEAEERFRRAFDDAPIGMALVGLDGRFLRTNMTFSEITGYSQDELLALTYQQITHPADLNPDGGQQDALLAGTIRSYQLEKRYRRSDARLIWVALSVSLVRTADGEPLYTVAQVEDISDRKAAERELRHLADTDGLTGVLNRRRFLEELQRELHLIDRMPGRGSALLLLDLDRFKTVNDTLGHRAGDKLLRSVAETLTARLRATDLVARLGGDEFAAILPGVSDLDNAGRIARQIAEALREQTVPTPGGPVAVAASIGVVLLDGVNGGSAEDALAAADHAMYRAKHDGRDQIANAA